MVIDLRTVGSFRPVVSDHPFAGRPPATHISPAAGPGGPSTSTQPAPTTTVEQLAERLRAMEEMNRKLAEKLERTTIEHNEQMKQLIDRYESCRSDRETNATGGLSGKAAAGVSAPTSVGGPIPVRLFRTILKGSLPHSRRRPDTHSRRPTAYEAPAGGTAPTSSVSPMTPVPRAGLHRGAVRPVHARAGIPTSRHRPAPRGCR